MKTAMHGLPAAFLLLLAFFTPGASADDATLKGAIWNLVSEDQRIPSDTPGIDLFLRNKNEKDRTTTTGRVLRYVHGAIYPSESAFDLKLDGLSWMDYIAALQPGPSSVRCAHKRNNVARPAYGVTAFA